MLALIATNLPDTTAQDVVKVFSDFHITVSLSTVALGLVCLKAAMGYIRNFALKDQTKESTGVIGRTIAHLAGNSLPSQPIDIETKAPIVPENKPVVQTPTVPLGKSV